MRYAKLQRIMQDALLENTPEAAHDFAKGRDSFSPAEQMAIYINAYRHRLYHVLKADYSATCHILGEQAFQLLAFAYIKAHPSPHFNIDRYGFWFADWVETHCKDPFVQSLAKLECSIAQVFFMPDSEPLSLDSLSQLQADSLGAKVLVPRAAHILLDLPVAVHEFLKQFRQDGKVERPSLQTAEWLIIHRHENLVKANTMRKDEFLLFSALSRGVTLEEVLEKTISQFSSPFDKLIVDIMTWIPRWTTLGLLQRF